MWNLARKPAITRKKNGYRSSRSRVESLETNGCGIGLQAGSSERQWVKELANDELSGWEEMFVGYQKEDNTKEAWVK